MFDFIRAVSPYVGIMCAAVLSYRAVTTWRYLTALSRSLVVVLAMVVAIQTYGSTRSLISDVRSLHDVMVLIFLGRLVVLGLGVWWPWQKPPGWDDRKHRVVLPEERQ